MKKIGCFLFLILSFLDIEKGFTQADNTPILLTKIVGNSKNGSEYFTYYYNSSKQLDSIIYEIPSKKRKQKSICKYNSDHSFKTLEEFNWYKGKWDKSTLYEYEYNQKGLLIRKNKSVVSGNSYVHFMESTYKYDTNNRLILKEEWDIGSDIMMPETHYKYDKKNRLEEIIKIKASSADSIEKIHFSYYDDKGKQIQDKSKFIYQKGEKIIDYIDHFTYSETGVLINIERYIGKSKKVIIRQRIRSYKGVLLKDIQNGVTPESYLPDYIGDKYARHSQQTYIINLEGKEELTQSYEYTYNQKLSEEINSSNSNIETHSNIDFIVKYNTENNSILIKNISKNSSFTIYNLLGEKVWSKYLKKNEFIHLALPPNTYIIKNQKNALKINIS